MRRPTPALIALAATLALALLAPAAVRAQPAAPSLEQVKNATYPVAVAPGGTATLVDGAFVVAAAPGSASRPRANAPTRISLFSPATRSRTPPKRSDSNAAWSRR